VSVILPTLEEAENIDWALAEVSGACDRAHLDLEVLVVDDGSRDGTCSLRLNGERTVPQGDLLGTPRNNLDLPPTTEVAFAANLSWTPS
jgi:hypothetical protein